MSDLVQRAEALARAVHEGQTDRGGAPYHLHLERVADRVDPPEFKVVAWLHDSVEDTELTLDIIRDNFSCDITNAIDLLTHAKGVTYWEYVDRIEAAEGYPGVLAQEVKIADLLDNMDPRRKTPSDPEFYERSMVKHWRALNRLLCGEWPT